MMSQTQEDNAFFQRRKMTVKSINMHAHVVAFLATDVIVDTVIMPCILLHSLLFYLNLKFLF